MYLLNKNIDHNGKQYPKGCEIKKDDGNFAMLMNAGHVDEIKPTAKAPAEAAPEVGQSAEQSASKPEEQSAGPAKPARSSR